MSIIDTYILSIPAFFERLLELESISQEDITAAGDGFFAVTKSISTILHSKGIDTFPDNQDQLLDCHNYFDDWYLYAVPSMNGHVYSLFKMREQEHDADMGLAADGDTPGVTISFIAFNTDILKQCLFTPDYANRKALGIEINRVVSYRKQLHNPYLKCYFIRPEVVGTYMIADLYTQKNCVIYFRWHDKSSGSLFQAVSETKKIFKICAVARFSGFEQCCSRALHL